MINPEITNPNNTSKLFLNKDTLFVKESAPELTPIKTHHNIEIINNNTIMLDDFSLLSKKVLSFKMINIVRIKKAKNPMSPPDNALPPSLFPGKANNIIKYKNAKTESIMVSNNEYPKYFCVVLPGLIL